MLELELLSNKYFLIVVSAMAGILGTLITQRVLNKRGRVSYSVSHSKVGASVAHPIFGNVKVTWNESPIPNLFFSSIELKNESLNDYLDVLFTVLSSNTFLLSESTSIQGTPYIVEWSDDFRRAMHVEAGKAPTEEQGNTYRSRREYSIPVLNRGQSATLNYLNAPHAENIPEIWVSANIKGMKLVFRAGSQQAFGVPVWQAGLAGIVSGFAIIVPLVVFLPNLWIVALVAFTYGLIAQMPGALLVRGYRFIREIIGG